MNKIKHLMGWFFSPLWLQVQSRDKYSLSTEHQAANVP